MNHPPAPLHLLRFVANEAIDAKDHALLQMLTSRASGKVGQMINCRVVDSKLSFVMVDSSSTTERYLVIPGLFCSCPYFRKQVFEQGTDWTCKHLMRLSVDSSFVIVDGEAVSEIYSRFSE